jgi:hypothetical protein
MTAVAEALRPPSKTLLFLEGRALHELGAFMLLRPWLAAAPRGDGHPVLVLPGLLASDMSTRPLRSFLATARSASSAGAWAASTRASSPSACLTWCAR